LKTKTATPSELPFFIHIYRRGTENAEKKLIQEVREEEDRGCLSL
jgi:hypothetical protein